MGSSAHEIKGSVRKLLQLSMETRFFIDIEEVTKAMTGRLESPLRRQRRLRRWGFESFCLTRIFQGCDVFYFEFFFSSIIRPHITAAIPKRLENGHPAKCIGDLNSF